MNEQNTNKRQSFEVEGLGDANPIPAVSRIGNLVVTGGVSGTGPSSR